MRQRWLSWRALGLHLVLLVWFPGCLLACWWQVTVALAGDSLGWLYSVEWPCFALFGVYVWWGLIHDDLSKRRRVALHRVQRKEAATLAAELGERSEQLDEAEAEDPRLAAYNEYLASLAEESKSWRRR